MVTELDLYTAGGVGLAARGAGAGSVLDNGAATVPAVGFAIPGDGFAVAVVVVVVLVVGRAISRKAIDATLDDTVDEIFCVLVDVFAVLVGRVPVNLLEERRRLQRGLDSRLITKHVGVAVVIVVVVVLVVGRAIAWKAIDASLEDTVVGFGGVIGDALVIRPCR
eukprot:CAMPEP_0168173126 /NCGR_PEP_ID=MMETSP0139_2-20121125/5689_1 /TAXON_ID=44445 /ORGANISM="Pseudo-nitzschia australis, Strain 10249 10 AB" /LENGTH=164 /DNA_ID=CAMNT_0008090959 /DNA_START=207 /DNA_END=698 /DNA_ORIENTATION=+